MPDIIIVAGPNGAGKSSFATAHLPKLVRRFTYINADEIEKELRGDNRSKQQVELQASRLMLNRIDSAVEQSDNIMIETTLATRTYARKIARWKDNGYSIALVYLRLPSAEHAIERVARRVAAGGHDIPELIIRRRFTRSLENLDEVYKPIVNEWYVWESLEGDFIPAEAWDIP
jgi:predicted ABC-type ATPase